MTSFLFIFLNLAFSQTPQAPDQTPRIFEFTENSGYIYSLSLADVKPGFTATIIARGFMAGSVKAGPGVPDTPPSDISKLFQFQIENDGKDTAKLETMKQEMGKMQKDVGTHSSSTAAPVAPPPSAPTADSIDWDEFIACSRRQLPFLRQAIALKSAITSDAKAEKIYYLTKSLIEENSTPEGFVCGRFLKPSLQVRVSDDIQSVKIIAAMISRKKEDREILLKTLAGAFSEKSPWQSRNLFAYYFAEQFFTAALTKKSLPTYDELNTKIVAQPDVQTLIVETPDKKVENKLTLNVTDVEDLYKVGLKFLNEVGL